MIAEEINSQAKGNPVLNIMFQDALISVMDGIYNQLEAGKPPSCIDALKGCDYEEVVSFLCAYHRIKMEQVGKK